ncbi:hypothetical protein CHS0354_037009 [Potamilus streckersoni]|uniref:ITPR-interacting domain-containing protein n=1 Tax=Potamilus streckersoni TaxID=2493646 RepID=A0AAE0VWS1_9BIVA|nr:hypothetical protein CHS0354_037009 [Potamilus streckersoni]
MTKVASSDNAVSNKVMKPNTGGSDGPSKEPGEDQRRDQNGSDVKEAFEENHDPFEESPNPKDPEFIRSQKSLDDEESSQIEAEAIDAELPVGVDAVSLGQSSVRSRDQKPDQKSDEQLVIYEQNGIQIGPKNKRVQWIQSMDKSKGSSSNSSGSVEMILHDREMDPEDVLKNLGFCGKELETDTSFARVPDRFFLTSSAATGIDQVQIVWDHPEIHHLIPLMQRKENHQQLTEVNGSKTGEVKGARGQFSICHSTVAIPTRFFINIINSEDINKGRKLDLYSSISEVSENESSLANNSMEDDLTLTDTAFLVDNFQHDSKSYFSVDQDAQIDPHFCVNAGSTVGTELGCTFDTELNCKVKGYTGDELEEEETTAFHSIRAQPTTLDLEADMSRNSGEDPWQNWNSCSSSSSASPLSFYNVRLSPDESLV